MNLNTRNKISKFINDIISLTKILFALLLIVVVFAWAIQFFELDVYLPFFNSTCDFLTEISNIFYTPNGDDEESFNALLYMAIALSFFLLVFDTTSNIMEDLLKLHDRHQEQLTAQENLKINKHLQEKYKQHLSTSYNFTVIFKLEINKDNNLQAFQDDTLEKKLKKEEETVIKDIYTIISNSIKCPQIKQPQLLIFDIKNAEELNKALNFIVNICNIEKYVQKKISYYIAITTHNPNEPATTAIEEGLRLIELQNKRKILCHQIVCECLKTIKNCQFRFENNGSYSTDENETIFELVNKN